MVTRHVSRDNQNLNEFISVDSIELIGQLVFKKFKIWTSRLRFTKERHLSSFNQTPDNVNAKQVSSKKPLGQRVGFRDILGQ